MTTKYLKNVNTGVIVPANEHNSKLPEMEPYELPKKKVAKKVNKARK